MYNITIPKSAPEHEKITALQTMIDAISEDIDKIQQIAKLYGKPQEFNVVISMMEKEQEKSAMVIQDLRKCYVENCVILEK